jgi:hypothetical protein
MSGDGWKSIRDRGRAGAGGPETRSWWLRLVPRLRLQLLRFDGVKVVALHSIEGTRRMRRTPERIGLVAALVLCTALVAAATATAGYGSTNIYDSYACTLQGTPGLTYIVEGARYSTLRSACLSFKGVLQQRQLRWGLHSPSFSSGERAQATWIAPSLKLKLTMLSVDVPAKAALIRAVGHILKPTIWHRASTSYYP